jgi:AcrR family transcriptional regulator
MSTLKASTAAAKAAAQAVSSAAPTAAAAKPRPTRSESQRQSILDAASRLFIEKGFGGTNINAIADAMGVTRTALYYYFPSKESILEALTDEVTEQAGRLARTISARDELPPEQALHQLILQHASLVLAHPLQFRVVERSESSLPPERQAAAQASRRSVLTNFVRVIQRGIDNGDFRPTDARVAAFSIIGMCNWSAWWFEPGGALSAEQVAGSIAEFGLRAVAVEKLRPEKPSSPQETLKLLKADLSLLERQLKPREE